MIMAKIQELYDRASGETMYPVSTTGAVICPNGSDLETRLTSERKDIESRLGNVRAKEVVTPDNFPDIDVLTREELKMDLFIDMFNAKCIKAGYGRYDPDNAPDAQHPFFLNELWLTYEDALAVDRYSTKAVITDSRSGINVGFGNQACRTLYPMLTMPSASLYGLTMYSKIETVRIIPYYSSYFNCTDLRTAFKGTKLKKVFGAFNFPQVASPNYTIYDFAGYELEEFSGSKLKCSISVDNSPKLNLHTFQFMVARANNGTTPITITVHPNVYAKLTDETNTEWHKVLIDAAAKNITFATV